MDITFLSDEKKPSQGEVDSVEAPASWVGLGSAVGSWLGDVAFFSQTEA